MERIQRNISYKKHMRELLIEWLLNYLLISLVLWQIGFIIHLLLKNHYGKRPKEIYKSIPTAPTAVEVELPNRKKDIGVVDVSVKKHIVAEKPTDFKLDSDETIDGSVKLQKDKLKELNLLPEENTENVESSDDEDAEE